MRSLLYLLASAILAPCLPAEEYVFQDGPRLPRVIAASAVVELADGGAVTAGGFFGAGPSAPIGEVLRYQPATGNWVNAGTLSVARGFASATRLASGQVLIVGGSPDGMAVANVDLFDPATGLCQPAASMLGARQFHTATLLTDGRLLVLGGTTGNGDALGSGELYDPVSGTWAQTMAMPRARGGHSAVRLADGRVLVLGGRGSVGSPGAADVDIYQPATNSWTPAMPLQHGGSSAAALLADGRVLSISGNASGACEVYDPGTGAWIPVGAMQLPGQPVYALHRLPSGRVLAVRESSADVFDPATASWTPFGALQVPRNTFGSARLTDGRVILVGGVNFNVPQATLDSTEVLGPRLGAWSVAPSLATARLAHSANPLADGCILVAGGFVGNKTPGQEIASVEIFDSRRAIWSPGPDLQQARGAHASILLSNGALLVAGGRTAQGVALSSVEAFDPATGLWQPAGSLSQARSSASPVLLPDGRALFFGGNTASAASAAIDVYDPATQTTSYFATMSSPRSSPAVGLLPDGRVLVVGADSPVSLSAEIFDPVTKTFAPASLPSAEPATYAALPSGKLLLTTKALSGPSSTEIYEPAAGAWRVVARHRNTDNQEIATLTDGRILTAGLVSEMSYERRFDPASEQWQEAAALLVPRIRHRLVRLPDGRALAIGGARIVGPGQAENLASCEYFVPSVPAASPVLSSLQPQPIGVQLTWQGAGANRPYRIEFAASPAAPWQAVTGVVFSNAAGQLGFFDGSQPRPSARFYRTVLLP